MLLNWCHFGWKATNQLCYLFSMMCSLNIECAHYIVKIYVHDKVHFCLTVASFHQQKVYRPLPAFAVWDGAADDAETDGNTTRSDVILNVCEIKCLLYNSETCC